MNWQFSWSISTNNSLHQNELMSKARKRVYAILNYSKHFLILVSAITECVSISVFVSLLGIPTGTTSSAIGLMSRATVAGIKTYR